MGLVRVVVSNELLSQMLFPKGAKIMRMRHEESPVMRAVPDFEMVVEHEELPEVGEGDVIPQVCPTYGMNNSWPSGAPDFLGWGLESAEVKG